MQVSTLPSRRVQGVTALSRGTASRGAVVELQGDAGGRFSQIGTAPLFARPSSGAAVELGRPPH